MKQSNKINEDHFLQRYLDGFYTKNDVHKLQDLIKDSENIDTFNEISQKEWTEVPRMNDCGWEQERNKKEARLLLNRIEKKRTLNIRRFFISLANVAAVIFIIVGISAYRSYWNKQQIIYLETSTSYGEKKTVILPDGTELILNSCSKVRYPDRFITDERRIELEGEGYFQVESNEKQPFIVNTNKFDVKVLGTKFNVKSYPTDQLVSVKVESGKVQVNMPEATMRLKACEQVSINTITGNFYKTEIDTLVAQWQKGSLKFHQTPIHDVAKELERIYNCTIILAEGEFNNLITGEHDNESLEDVLKSLEFTSDIHYRKNGNQIILYK